MGRTIAAISTAQGVGGIAVIRVSGDRAIEIADKVFSGKDRLADAPTHTVHYGFIKKASGEKADEVLATVMRAPRTFTKEDVVEISTHGGIAASREVLGALIEAGAYMAEAGEFTKRAFLNGRIDLSQAEAVIDIINSKNDMSRRSALSQLEGSLSVKISELRGKLLYLAAQMQVTIDYPDEDLEDITIDGIRGVLEECRTETEALIKSADSGRILRDGIKTAIVGKPNVGKSSLLNSLSGAERAIVTDIAGTTRDTIEEYVSLNGIPLLLTDTAGIRATDDAVEKIGVERSKRSIDEADLVIAMLDGSCAPDSGDAEVLAATEGKKRIILINKTDIGDNKHIARIKAQSDGGCVLEVSAKTGYGLDALAEKIKEMYDLGAIAAGDGAIVTNMRHKSALADAEASLCRAIGAIDSGMPSDIASIDINAAIESLGEITGETVSEDIVNTIFHEFCVGK